MLNATEIKGGDFCACEIEECPKHAHGELKREYTFGMQDATVATYTCGCAVVTTELSSMDGGGYWYPSYSEAAGAATLQKMMNAAR
jgi:hypothetical protein